jgi:predicted RecA/RadA family phage recombinase
MSTNKIQDGVLLTIPAPADVASGAFVRVADIAGVAVNSALSGADVVIDTEGVFELPKATGEAWTLGARLYWDATAGKFTTTSTSNTRVGAAAVAALSADTIGVVKLNGVIG